MAYGMPIISSMADGTIADLVYDGLNGYLIDDKDLTIEFIYKTCKRAVQIERSRLMEMGVESRKIVSSKATLSNMVNGYEKAILYGMSQL
jgi:hypothetical protein